MTKLMKTKEWLLTMRIIYDKTRDWWVDDSWVGEWSNMNPTSLCHLSLNVSNRVRYGKTWRSLSASGLARCSSVDVCPEYFIVAWEKIKNKSVGEFIAYAISSEHGSHWVFGRWFGYDRGMIWPVVWYVHWYIVGGRCLELPENVDFLVLRRRRSVCVMIWGFSNLRCWFDREMGD